MQVKTSELTGSALDWAVAKCEDNGGVWCVSDGDVVPFTPSTDWAQGGPIIERERISLGDVGIVNWKASVNKADMYAVTHYGDTPLIAAMRCYVASKLGDNVDIPHSLA